MFPSATSARAALDDAQCGVCEEAEVLEPPVSMVVPRGATLTLGARLRAPTVPTFSVELLESIEGYDATELIGCRAPRGVHSELVSNESAAAAGTRLCDSDSASHFDLGVAYAHMGLANEAVREFELACKDDENEAACRSLIGGLYMQAGRIDAAIDSFVRGLQTPTASTQQRRQLGEQLRDAHEMRSRFG